MRDEKVIHIDTFGSMGVKPLWMSQEAWERSRARLKILRDLEDAEKLLEQSLLLKEVNHHPTTNYKVAVREWTLEDDHICLKAEYTIGKNGTAVPSFETTLTRRHRVEGERFFDANVAKILKKKYPQFKGVVVERGKIYFPKDGLKFMLAIAANYSILKRPSYFWSEVIEYKVKPPAVPKMRRESCGAGWCGTQYQKRMSVRGRKI